MNIKNLPKIEYTQVRVGDGRIKVSPSSIGTFRRNPREWRFGSEFKGNKSAVTGTCVHAIFEYVCILFQHEYTEAKILELSKEIIDTHIVPYLDEEVIEGSITEEERVGILRDVTVAYFQPILTYCKSRFFMGGVTIENEKELLRDLKKSKLTLAGTTDAVVTEEDGSKVIVDFKWTKSAIRGIASYIPQLLCYAFMEKGVTHVEIVNITFTKTYGVRIKEFRKEITKEHKNKFMGLLNEIDDTVKFADKHPEYENLIFRQGVDYFGKFEL